MLPSLASIKPLTNLTDLSSRFLVLRSWSKQHINIRTTKFEQRWAAGHRQNRAVVQRILGGTTFDSGGVMANQEREIDPWIVFRHAVWMEVILAH